MKRPVISVAAGNGPALLFPCWLLVKYTYVRMGKTKIDSRTAACVVAGSAMSMTATGMQEQVENPVCVLRCTRYEVFFLGRIVLIQI
jgi:hypothetical protein